MWTVENNVLIRDSRLPNGYWIVEKSTRSFALLDNDDEAKAITEQLLLSGVEIFESDSEFYEKYPPLTLEDRKRITEEFLRNASGSK